MKHSIYNPYLRTSLTVENINSVTTKISIHDIGLDREIEHFLPFGDLEEFIQLLSNINNLKNI